MGHDVGCGGSRLPQRLGMMGWGGVHWSQLKRCSTLAAPGAGARGAASASA